MMGTITMRCFSPKAAAWLLAPALAGCWQSGKEAAPLVVTRTSPALGDPAQPVLLNDALTVYFSEDLRHLSVTPDSVTVLDEQGHQVPGRLLARENWISFVPTPPMSASLDDGSFRPGARYRLQLAGHPRPDSIRAADGRWLDAAVTFDVFVAERGHVVTGLPSILRPTASDLPFLMRRPEAALPVAADDPRLLVHFTLPLLPGSVTADAFRVQVLGSTEELVPRAVAVVTSPLDEHPGSSVAIDLGGLPRLRSGADRPLNEGDWISVAVRSEGPLTNYAGHRPLPGTPGVWSVVAGDSVPICSWPGGDAGFSDRDRLAPGFEVRGAAITPRVRVEAGSGALGVFRPQRDTTLRPGAPFDRGDGVVQVSQGGVFAFSAIDIPDGVTVTVDAQSGPVQLCATGGVRVAGALSLLAPTAPLPPGQFARQPVAALVERAPVSVVAAGLVCVEGAVVAGGEVPADRTPLLLAGAAGLELRGELPFQTVLAVETGPGPGGATIEGARGQSKVYPATFTPGLAPGSDFEVTGLLPWQQMPAHRDSGVVQLEASGAGVRAEWQVTSPDPIRGETPDLSVGRMGRWQVARDRDRVVTGASAFVRFRLQARVQSGRTLPSIERLRLVEPR